METTSNSSIVIYTFVYRHMALYKQQLQYRSCCFPVVQVLESYVSNSASHKTSQIHYSNMKDKFWKDFGLLYPNMNKRKLESHLSHVACMLTSDPKYTFLLIFLFRFDSINLFQTHFNNLHFYGKNLEYYKERITRK